MRVVHLRTGTAWRGRRKGWTVGRELRLSQGGRCWTVQRGLVWKREELLEDQEERQNRCRTPPTPTLVSYFLQDGRKGRSCWKIRSRGRTGAELHQHQPWRRTSCRMG